MANDKKFVEEITAMNVDFAKWYTDVVKKADLADYTSVKGCMLIRPLGYAIWENIQAELDKRFKETGHENVYLPLFIPESLLNKEKEHVEGFAPEVAWVTHGGKEELTERLCVRPTSETLFCQHYANIIGSYRDLPKLYNQWANVVRWEKTTRPFLRTTEFLWQEGHTAHATYAEAQEETLRMLDVYAEFCHDFLAIPVIKGQKTDKEKFAGAVATYTIESLMHDGQALQTGTTHNFGDNFAKAFNIRYLDQDNTHQHVFQTSWGVTTRLIGALIMVHGDDSGLVLPPKVAPTQLVIIPIASHKGGVLERATDIYTQLKDLVRVKIDNSDKNPGWKFSEHEMKGVPLRLEIGPKDIEKGQVVLVRRDNREKIIVALSEIKTRVPEILDDIQKSLLAKALSHREAHTSIAYSLEQIKESLDKNPGFVKTMWCKEQACEEKVKEEAKATSRCIPFEQENIDTKCAICEKPAKTMIVWGRAY